MSLNTIITVLQVIDLGISLADKASEIIKREQQKRERNLRDVYPEMFTGSA